MSPAVAAFAEEYLNYIRATYMNGNYSTATEGFEWNVYDDIEQGFLTNNPSEGANNRLREDIKTKNTLQFGHCPNVGGGGFTLARIFLTLF